MHTLKRSRWEHHVLDEAGAEQQNWVGRRQWYMGIAGARIFDRIAEWPSRMTYQKRAALPPYHYGSSPSASSRPARVPRPPSASPCPVPTAPSPDPLLYLRAGGTREPGWGRAHPIHRTLGTSCAPSTGPRLATPLPSAPEPCFYDSLNVPLKHETLATWNTKQMKLLKHTVATCVLNICNIQIKHLQLVAWKRHLLQHKTEIGEIFQIYSWNICVKHTQHSDKKCLQYTSETDEIFWTNTCNKPVKHLQHASRTLCKICNI
jgi:hypothetical protein